VNDVEWVLQLIFCKVVYVQSRALGLKEQPLQGQGQGTRLFSGLFI